MTGENLEHKECSITEDIVNHNHENYIQSYFALLNEQIIGCDDTLWDNLIENEIISPADWRNIEVMVLLFSSLGVNPTLRDFF